MAGPEGHSCGVMPDSDELGGQGAGADRSMSSAACALSLKGSPQKNRKDTGPATALVIPVVRTIRVLLA